MLSLSVSTGGASTASLSQCVISLSWGKNKNSLDAINHLKLRLFPCCVCFFFFFLSPLLHCVPLQLVWLSLLFLLLPDIDAHWQNSLSLLIYRLNDPRSLSLSTDESCLCLAVIFTVPYWNCSSTPISLLLVKALTVLTYQQHSVEWKYYLPFAFWRCYS